MLLQILLYNQKGIARKCLTELLRISRLCPLWFIHVMAWNFTLLLFLTQNFLVLQVFILDQVTNNNGTLQLWSFLLYFFPYQAFNTVFSLSIAGAEPCEDVKERVNSLIDCITYSVFIYTTRGLFEADKLIFTTQVAFQVSSSIKS